MSNVFKENQGVNEHPNRNNFDLSFQNHLTMKFGIGYPVLCKEVVPGDSFQIDSAFGLKFMPMVFPVQSQIRATLHFFYCRNKNLWKHWQDWLSGQYSTGIKTSSVEHPYIFQPASWFKSGSLADYLDVPTTVVSSQSSFGIVTSSNSHTIISAGTLENSIPILPPVLGGNLGNVLVLNQTFAYHSISALNNLNNNQVNYLFYPCSTPIPSILHEDHIFLNSPYTHGEPLGVAFYSGQGDLDNARLITNEISSISATNNNSAFNKVVRISQTSLDRVNQHIALGENVYIVFYVLSNLTQFTDFPSFVQNVEVIEDKSLYISSAVGFSFDVTIPHEAADLGAVPFDKDTNLIRLNALPFRAYESIYNCYYRNTQNQPFTINGEIENNKYITTDDDGADTTDYQLFKRNYEMDFLTSALPSPQQGNAPLVGMSALGNITIESDDGITTAKAEVADDGNTIVGVHVTSPVAGRDHALTLAEIASSGMSISDFRQTNALTRWLEVNIRKGFRYRDFIAGHFGKEPEYRELDMPEFIGGYSRDVSVNSVVNQTSGGVDPLGSFAGNANCFGASEHSITHYCDDYGWIIGILTIVPTPAYSQLLPKHFLKSSPLDYYFPEFSNVSMQPVTYEEVCPNQAFLEYLNDHSKTLQDTFGYQRPNYDMVAFTDQVHGDFRGDMRNFLINRVFGSRPELGNEFLQINPNEVNDIFSVTTPDKDVVAGQIIFRIFAKRPIPRVSIPSLGR